MPGRHQRLPPRRRRRTKRPIIALLAEALFIVIIDRNRAFAAAIDEISRLPASISIMKSRGEGPK